MTVPDGSFQLLQVSMNSTNFEQLQGLEWNSMELVSSEMEDSKFHRKQPTQMKDLIY